MLTKVKTKKCRVCKSEFTPRNSTQAVCNFKCAVTYARQQSEKEQEKKAKVERKYIREQKEKLKTRAQWLKEAQTEFNKYIRARDEGLSCVSCDKPNNGTHQRHASHYRPATNTHLRFHEMNVHASCQQCNTTLSGNLIEYRIRLVKKIGVDNVEWLESHHKAHKLTIDEIKEIKAFYKEKLKFLKSNDTFYNWQMGLSDD